MDLNLHQQQTIQLINNHERSLSKVFRHNYSFASLGPARPKGGSKVWYCFTSHHFATSLEAPAQQLADQGHLGEKYLQRSMIMLGGQHPQLFVTGNIHHDYRDQFSYRLQGLFTTISRGTNPGRIQVPRRRDRELILTNHLYPTYVVQLELCSSNISTIGLLWSPDVNSYLCWTHSHMMAQNDSSWEIH